MPATKTIRIATTEDSEVVELERLREEWTAARRQLDTVVLSGECSVSGCRTMPFVALKTNIGRRSLCLRHFEKVSAEAI
jgi:hypothetical protein